MKIYIKLTLLVLATVFYSCQKGEDVEMPHFSVSVDKDTVKLGEYVNFIFEGNPGLITFYSGEIKNEYSYKNVERVDRIKNLVVSFETYNQAAESVPFKIMYSNNFNGIYDIENVNSSSWVDITDRFVIAESLPTYNAQLWTKSEEKDIADLLQGDKPFYIAFKYDLPEYTESGTIPYRRWRFKDFKLESISQFGIYEALAYITTKSAGWRLVQSDTTVNTISNLASSIVLFAPPAALPDSRKALQIWAVSKVYYPEINMGVDKGVSIKNYLTPTMKNFEYLYEKVGKYKATFVAANTTIYDSKEVVKEIEITVIP